MYRTVLYVNSFICGLVITHLCLLLAGRVAKNNSTCFKYPI